MAKLHPDNTEQLRDKIQMSKNGHARRAETTTAAGQHFTGGRRGARIGLADGHHGTARRDRPYQTGRETGPI